MHLKMEGGFRGDGGLKVILCKINVLVNSGITRDGLSTSKYYPYVIYSFTVKVISVLCVKLVKWINSRCARVKKMNQNLLRNLLAGNVKIV